jgi:hypothetical protein
MDTSSHPSPRKCALECAREGRWGKADLVTSGRGSRSWECVNSASIPGMGPLPGGPLSLRPALAATLPGAGRHNQVSWAGITLPSPARPGPGGGPGASEPVRLGSGRRALLPSRSGWAPTSSSACPRHVVAKGTRPDVPGLDPHPQRSPVLSSTLSASRMNRNAF